MDSLIRFFLVIFFILLLVFVVRKKEYVHPFVIINIFFFLPLFFALGRHSDLQSEVWQDETYLVIFYTLIFWQVLFACHAFFSKLHINRVSIEYYLNNRFKNISIFFSFFVVGLFLLANYLQSNLILVFLDPEVASQIHAEFPPVIRLFARMILLAVILLYLSYYKFRSKWLLLLMLLTLLTPVTRLSRIDILLSLVGVMILFYYFPIMKINKKKVLITFIIGLFLMSAITNLGVDRWNRFGEYDFSYSETIEWNGPLKDTIIPILYGYFPLSFENFDRYIVENRVDNDIAFSTLEGPFVGILKLNLLFDDYKSINYLDYYEPVSGAATVPTILIAFYRDFGAYFSIFPIALVGLLWLYLYRVSGLSLQMNLIYIIYSAAFSLASFQPILFSPMIFQQFVMVFIMFYFIKYKRTVLKERKRPANPTYLNP